MAASPDFATAGEHSIITVRLLLRNAIRWLQPSPRVRVTAPANVEVVVTDDAAGRKLRVHFIAYNPTPRSTPSTNRPFVLPGLIEDVPIFRAAIGLSFDPVNVEAANASTTLRADGHRIAITIEDIHEVVVVNY